MLSLLQRPSPMVEPSPEAWLEAADTLDVAHDVLMTTGVFCGETQDQIKKQHSHDTLEMAEENCTWQAIAIARGLYDNNQCPNWQEQYRLAVAGSGLESYPDVNHILLGYDLGRGDMPSEVDAAIGHAMDGFSWHKNDHATQDEVFDRLRSAAKFAREQAGGADS